jgi:plastocyanin
VKRLIGFAVGLSLVAAAPASAQEPAPSATFQGLDTLVWDKAEVSIQPGQSVRWTFDGTTQFHNVWSDTGPWPELLRSPLGAPAPPVQRTFDAVGDYAFFCQVHPDTMRGVVHVGTNSAPVVVPLSQQAFTNDDASVLAAETGVTFDKAKPRLSSVSAKRTGKGRVRVRARVSEESDVTVAFKRGGRTIKSGTVSGTGTRSLTVRGLKAGRYSVQVRATDIAGNRSSLRKLTLNVK